MQLVKNETIEHSENEDQPPTQVENIACRNPHAYDSDSEGSQPLQDENYDKGSVFDKNDDRKPAAK